jgi:hypothetical protein
LRILQKVLRDHGSTRYAGCRESGGFGRSHSLSFDHRRRPETLRTAMATAFFCPISTTSPCDVMLAILRTLGIFVRDLLKSRHRLQAENLFLRHQLNLP